MKKNIKSSSGFTLAEMLVVISVLAVVGIIFTEIFFRSLRGSNKAQVINKMKQEGQNALNIMDRDTRDAEKIVCPVVSRGSTTSSGKVLVLFKESTYIKYIYIPNSIDTNGIIKKDHPEIAAGETEIEFLNRICQEGDPLLQSTTITDDNLKTGVSIIGDEVFTREIKPGQKDFLTINFQVIPPVEAPQAVVKDIDPVQFQTTVGLR